MSGILLQKLWLKLVVMDFLHRSSGFEIPKPGHPDSAEGLPECGQAGIPLEKSG